jgi:hypothetical protein
MNVFATILVNSWHPARPTELRKVISLALCFTLVLVPLLGKGEFIPKAKAQDPINVNFCGGTNPTGDPNRVIQPCSKLNVGLIQDLENQVIAELLLVHQLPAADKSRLLGWERNLIRADIYNKILGFIKKTPATRSVTEQLFVSKLTELVKERRILSATKSLDEYNRWANNPCTYIAPTGFSYSLHCSCLNQFCGIFEGPPPPTFEEFQNYGASIAYADYQSNPTLQAIAGDTARNVGILNGFSVIGLGAVIGGIVGANLTAGSAIIAAIHPFLAFTIAGNGTASAVAAAGGVAAGVSGAISIAAVAAIVILAVVIGVFQGIEVFSAAEIPGKLQSAKTTAINANIDLAQVLETATGKREVYAEFLQNTMPDFPATTGVPAVNASDKSFLLQPGDTVTPTIQYKDWVGNNHTARLSGGWFVDKKGSEPERLTLGIEYVDWTGKGWTASRVGNKYLHTRTGDNEATPFESTEIKYKDWTNAQFTTRINITNAAPTISLTSATVKQGGGSVFLEQLIGKVGDVDDLADNLPVSVISDNPSNGVSLNINPFHLGGDVAALVTATCSASNTSFTLRVSDPSGSSATATLNVTVIPNQAPVLAYQPTRSVALGSTLTPFPTTPLSDPDGTSPPSIGTPTISPATFTGTVIVSQSGLIGITNASPPGLYTITVPASDSCTTTNATFSLNVLCPLISASVSGGGLICPGSSPIVSVEVQGGTGPYTVILNDGQIKTSSSLPITFNVMPSTTTTYTATAIDAFGCPVTVSGGATFIPDNIAPVITVPTSMIVNGNLSGGANVTYSVTAADNSGAAPNLSLSKASGSVFPFGTTTVTATATDGCGNSSNASFTVTVRTLSQQASLIDGQVQSLVSAGTLTSGQGAGLSDRLNEITAKINQGQISAACNQLNAFINQVTGFIGGKLSAAQGQALISAANALQINLGCQ